jgi:hypothetical protein
MTVNSTQGPDSIRQLTVDNLRHPSAEIEAELVRLRIEQGRAQCESRATTEVRRPVSQDLFSGVAGLPEIHSGELTRDTLAAGILHHGAILVRGLYQAHHLARLQTLAAAQEDANREDTSPLGCTPHTLFELLEIYGDCGLLSVVGEYLGGEPVMFAERAKLRHHRAERDKYSAIPWHQDANFFGEGSYAINCWAAVTPCGADNPGLGIIPRRAEGRVGWREEDGIAPLDYGHSLPEGLLEELSAGKPPVFPVMEPGDALLFDEMTVHQTALKRWELREQVVTISWFFQACGFPGWGTPLAI